MVSDIQKRYILGEVEVVMTGRQASRPWTQKTRGREVKRLDVLVEVEPYDTKANGNWKKWIKPDELYEIMWMKRITEDKPPYRPICHACGSVIDDSKKFDSFPDGPDDPRSGADLDDL